MPTETTRRAFCRSTAALAAGTLAASGVAAAASEHFDAQPDHVSLSYEEDVLKQYQPKLVTDHLDVKPVAMHGWVARSPEHDTFVCCYFTVYTHQNSAIYIPTAGDAHFGDHEPVQIEVNSETGDPERVRASIYHWQKEEVHADFVPMNDAGTRPRLYAYNPHHHYRAANPDETAGDVELRDLTTVFEEWLEGTATEDGLKEDLMPGAFTNPWLMQHESDFWRNDIASFSLAAAYVGAMRATGLGGVAGSLDGN